MPKHKTIYEQREFLNEDKSMSGCIITHLEEFSLGTDKGKLYAYSYPVFDIADCSDKISLDFSFHTEEQMNLSMKKLKLFKDIVTGFYDEFEKEVKKFEEAKKKYAIIPKKARVTRRKKVAV